MMKIMTWGEFKEAIEKAGVEDDYAIEYIDIHLPGYDPFGDFEVFVDEERKEFTVH